MNINAHLLYKQQQIDVQHCTIEDIVELTESEYASLYQGLLNDRDFIAERKGLMKYDYKTDTEHCILVLGEGQEDGILIQSEGSAAAQGSAFIPNARAAVNNHIRQLAAYCVFEGTEHSEDGRWSISYEELNNHFGANITDQNGNGKLLEQALRQREEINELIMTEDCIEIAYHLEYCESCQQGGIEGTADLLSLVGCNIYDEHEDGGEDEIPAPTQTM